MRIWDIGPHELCRKHLLGEHRELHAIWTIVTENRKGYANHPETKRWVGKLKALFIRHHMLVIEMERRGYSHKSPLDESLATGVSVQNTLIDSIQAQRVLLRKKGCECRTI